MKLNEKGKELYKIWSEKWDESTRLEVAEHGEENAEYGWSAVEDRFVHNIEDECGLMVAVYGDSVIDDITKNTPYIDMEEEWQFGVSKKEFLSMLSAYIED